ncbi:unannotated protein [freshwater metagenome]|uniref:Unannotated protein n=1 Tax=freshwater metagenome TaxID=449393 RepID=A0A6J7IST3_9ZZZZ|nr:hypothetical protein [Actinomycetota bacterium]
MADSTTANRAAQTFQDLLANPYLRKLAQDPEIRDDARIAYDAARKALDRARQADSLGNAIFDDAKLHANIAKAANSIADARERLVTKPKRHPFAKAFVLLVAGSVLALVLSEELRNKVLDLLFGAEEEFDYVSTTGPLDGNVADSASLGDEA